MTSGVPTNLAAEGKILTLTLKGGGEDSHFLTLQLLKSLGSDLDKAKSKASSGSVLITTAEGRKFCEGFKFGDKSEYPEVIDSFKQLVRDYISLPMPTIAAVNGPARNAGLILAFSHDHLTMEQDDLVLSMMADRNTQVPDYFTAMIRAKVVPGAFSRLALNTLAFNSRHAKEMGLPVQMPHGKETPFQTAMRFAKELSRKGWDGDVYAEMRKALYPDLCKVLGLS